MPLTDFFIALLNMSLSATWAALLVMAARALLKRAPKIFSYSLWAVVLFRMVLVLFLSVDVQPDAGLSKTIPEDIIYASQPQIHSGIRILDQAVNGSLPAGTPAASVNPIQIFLAIAAFIWMMGVVLLLIAVWCPIFDSAICSVKLYGRKKIFFPVTGSQRLLFLGSSVPEFIFLWDLAVRNDSIFYVMNRSTSIEKITGQGSVTPGAVLSLVQSCSLVCLSVDVPGYGDVLRRTCDG